MRPPPSSPTGTFLKFVFGFVLFIGLSFGLTIAVNNYSIAQSSQQQAAAALAKVFK